jgi:uncharacterized membrane protein
MASSMHTRSFVVGLLVGSFSTAALLGLTLAWWLV